MLTVYLILGFVSGMAALSGLLLAGAPVWLAVLAYSLTGSLVVGTAALTGHWITLRKRASRKRPAARPIGIMALHPLPVRR